MATRLYYIDKLKVAVIIMVIAHHSGQAYGPTGGTWPISNSTISEFLGPFFAVNAMFGMGLLFLISGYFTARAVDHKGAAVFLKSRLARLGIPTFAIALFVFGPIGYASRPDGTSFVDFISYLYSTGWQELYAHLWFMFHLLVYSAVYVVWLQLISGREIRPNIRKRELTHSMILVFIIVLALMTFIARIWYPIDRWEPLLFVMPTEVAHLPQYVSMFVIGITAARYDWLRTLPTTVGMVWLLIGLIAASAYYVYDLNDLKFLPTLIARGGWNWRSMVFCLWEAVVCAGLSIGLLVLFRERLNDRPGKLLSALAKAAFGAYIIHIFIVIGLQAGLAVVSLAPLFKFVLVTMAGTVLSFGIIHLAQHVRWITKTI